MTLEYMTEIKAPDFVTLYICKNLGVYAWKLVEARLGFCERWKLWFKDENYDLKKYSTSTTTEILQTDAALVSFKIGVWVCYDTLNQKKWDG